MSSILVVEGEGSIARLLNDELGSEEYQTVKVLNGDDAVQFALREIPRMIIFDLTLPGLNGYEVIRQVREHPKCMHIPIIALGAYSSAAQKVRVLEAGADNYVVKPAATGLLPVDVADELLACVRCQIRRAQQCSLSPLTLLPGGLQLERAIDYKLSSVEPWSILYLDLDNFKAFNDVYGFLAGNSMILLVGHICQNVVYEEGNTDDFVGHVGGDDFVIVTTPERSHALCLNILTRYRRESALLYPTDDLERGTISGVDRKGRPYQSLSSLSLSGWSVVTDGVCTVSMRLARLWLMRNGTRNSLQRTSFMSRHSSTLLSRTVLASRILTPYARISASITLFLIW